MPQIFKNTISVPALRTTRRRKYALYTVLILTGLLFVYVHQRTLVFESHHPLQHPSSKTQGTEKRSVQFPLNKPLISLKDLKLQNGNHFCKQYFMETELHRTVEVNVFKASQPDPVCLVTQFTPSRLYMFKNLLHYWNGSISASLYTDTRDYISVKNVLEATLKAAGRNNVFIHLVIKDGEYYPINYLRNVAMRSEPGCTYQLILDVDFMTSPDLHAVLSRYQRGGIFESSNTLAVVIPAFSMLTEVLNNTDSSQTVPGSKHELLQMWKEQKLGQFHPRGNGHRVTNYGKWRNATKPYKISYEEGYEPYILVPIATAPYFVDLFLQRYGNKVSYFVELNARGFEFLVIPDGFVVHLPHPTNDTQELFNKIGSCTSKVFQTLKSRIKELKHNFESLQNKTHHL